MQLKENVNYQRNEVVLEGITVGGAKRCVNTWRFLIIEVPHAIFVGIHPFIDGNGRTSRLLLNLELMKDGFPPIVIKVDNLLA